MNDKKLNDLIEVAMEIEREEAWATGNIGFMARSLVQATMPHSKTTETVYDRQNGSFRLTMYCDPRIGLPYGTKPRLIMAFIASEAVRTKSREIILGDTLTEFMGNLGLLSYGGQWGSITMVKDQMKRLLNATISFSGSFGPARVSGRFNISSKEITFWDALPGHPHTWKSKIILTEDFYRDILNHPVSVDLRALNVLKDSSLALDIYCWLRYRLSCLREKTLIPWPILEMQFGCDYARLRAFKQNFLQQLQKVMVVLTVDISQENEGLVIFPLHSKIR